MAEIIFEEEKLRRERFLRDSSRSTTGGLLGFLMRTGITKTERASTVFLVIFILMFFLLSFFFWF